MEFRNPHILWGLVLIPLIYYYLRSRERSGSFGTAIFSYFPRRRTFRIWLLLFSKVILLLSFGCFILSLARPQRGYIEEKLITEGIDIVLAVDISSSMKAEDFKPNRLGAAKSVAKEFIRGRKNDKIGLVVFSRKAITHSPLTIDYTMLYNFIDTIETGMIQDGTAIGNAIIEGSKRLSEGKEKSKVLILLTDGINNAGEVDPVTAAYATKALGIKVYTIGVGSSKNAPFPIDDPVLGKRYVTVPVQIDEEGLQSIARITKGRYFRATDTKKLEEIYREIDTLERSKIEIQQFRRVREWFVFPLSIGIFLLCIHLVLQRLFLRIIP
ncbi:MAG: VWA domain-containing protein [Spirochaetota bacterium]|nr:MAG: VWA domain-containing protein [Spirochaetota bacterium]